MKYDYEEFCEALACCVKRLRKDRSLSHRRMVEEFGLHLDQIVRIENGRSVSLQTVLKLCAAFDVTMEEFMRNVSLAEQS